MYLNGELWRSYFHFNLDTIDHSLLINKVILMPPNVPARVLLPRSVNGPGALYNKTRYGRKILNQCGTGIHMYLLLQNVCSEHKFPYISVCFSTSTCTYALQPLPYTKDARRSTQATTPRPSAAPRSAGRALRRQSWPMAPWCMWPKPPLTPRVSTQR